MVAENGPRDKSGLHGGGVWAIIRRNGHKTMNTEPKRVKIFDSTLRDGEQSPGCSMNLADKLLVLEHLEALGVDVVEAGFAASSPGDFEAVQALARAAKKTVVASLARCRKADIDRAWEAVRGAKRPRLHVFIATSPLHMECKLRMSPEAVLASAEECVAYARSLCEDVEFSLEDCSRSERPFIYRVVQAAIEAGATTVNMPDTVGFAMPEEYESLFRDVLANVPGAKDVTLSCHCHNDLGLAVANSLAAVRGGAGQVECCLNGIGERAGNASLEEIVMALRTRHAFFGADTAVDASRIYAASKCVCAVTGQKLQANKAIVGENAFAHEAGIHQHGVLANPLTYEIMTPESIGLPKNKMVLGKHSGKHAFSQRLEDLGFRLDEARVDDLFAKFKVLADRKKTVSDADIEALAHDSRGADAPERIALDRFSVLASDVITPMGTVRVKFDGELVEKVGTGDGPVNACYAAIREIAGLPGARLEDYNLTAVDGGMDAQCKADVKVSNGGRTYRGSGVSTDIVEASVFAYIQALNAALAGQSAGPAEFDHPQRGDTGVH